MKIKQVLDSINSRRPRHLLKGLYKLMAQSPSSLSGELTPQGARAAWFTGAKMVSVWGGDGFSNSYCYSFSLTVYKVRQ